ncbi:MAG: FKBP-type peptidyl-prolyl cis-trans isomerase [Candidatus Nomurabacteria bacterium]|jgi:FKBP-type peptidyl-prolyl cis-trans isomerase|nr:FKBP-type peptidyl-prolyl cis-trans isomerase [Candidatus Nomurabacteria bacterium]
MRAIESNTTFWQRFGVMIVAVLMIGSTVALYVGIILSSKNGNVVAEQITPEKQARFQELLDAHSAEEKSLAAEQALGLSPLYYDTFNQYRDRVKAFNSADANNLTEVKTEDLLVGDGEEIGESTQYSMYYIGWLPDETMFDSSFEGSTLAFPLNSDSSYIDGWTEGVQGMKIGGVREITIPSSKAYGSGGSGDVIPADTPLKFVIMAVPYVPRPEVEYPDELLDLYEEIYGQVE